MKQISVLIFAFLQLGAGFAISQSTVTGITYKKELRPALSLKLMFPTQVAEQTILAKLKETGYRPQTNGNIFNKKNKEEGFYMFEGVQLPELANEKLDLYFKVDPVNADSSYQSTVSLLVSKGYDNFASREVDSATFGAAERFLNSFVQRTADFQVNTQLDDQKQMLGKVEDRWEKIRNKQSETRNKITQLEAEMKNMQQEEESLKQEAEQHRLQIKTLEGKRSSASY